MAKLKSMKYGTFTWNNNPSECSYECDKVYVTHKYPEYNGIDVEDFGVNAVILTGSGEFFGKNAYKYWDKLNTEFKRGDIRKMYHPIYKDLKYGLMTKLQSSLGSRENYISYTFEIVAGSNINVSKKAVVTTNGISGPKGTGGSVSSSSGSSGSGSGSSSTSSDNIEYPTLSFKVGDIVLITGPIYKNPYGTKMNTVSGKKTSITNVMPGTPYPLHFGSATFGWVAESSVTKYSVKALNALRSMVSNTPSASSNILESDISDFTLTKTIVHTMKLGETLKSVCAIYGISDWKSVAMANGIKNVNSVEVGQKIRIVKDR